MMPFTFTELTVSPASINFLRKDICSFHSSEDIAANVLAAGIDREVNDVFLHVKTMSAIGSGLAPAVKIRTGHRVTGFPLGGFPAGICINNAQ